MKTYEFGTVLIGTFFLAWIAYGTFFEGNVKKPDYTVISKHKDFEIREYEKIDVIATSVTNQNSAFRQLFNMIDGNNSKQEKIPMTAPVIQDQENMMFVMPSEMQSIPAPNDSNIKIKSFKKLKVAVKQFNGSTKNVEKKFQELKSNLINKSIKHTNNWYLCQYNSPWVFPLLRKNEIWVELN